MSNVDPAEIKKFNTQAQQWWDVDGPLKTLHAINPCRLDFITQQLELRDKKGIDIGCGGGILTEALALQGAKMTGLDLAEEALEAARQHAKQNQVDIDYHCGSVESFAEQHPQQFDVVTCLELLEHVPDPADIIRACAQLVKPGGHLFFSTLNRTWQSYLFAILAGEYVLRLIPRGTHDWGKFITPAELEQWLRNSQLQLKTIKGMQYSPLTRSCRLSDDVKVNYLVHCETGIPLRQGFGGQAP